MEFEALTLTRSQLRSRVVRELVGDRIVDIAGALAKPQTGSNADNPGNPIVNFLWNTAAKLAGFAVNAIAGLGGWLIRNIGQFIINSLMTIYTFDFAQTDAAIRQQMDQNVNTILTALGSLVGTGAVWISSIAIAGAATFKFPVIAGHVLLRLAEEGGEEIRGQVLNLFTVTRNVLSENLILSAFLTMRQLRLFGLQPVNQQREPWTIADQIEKRIESVQNTKLRAFLDGLKEGVEDSFFEALYVVSFGIEEAYMASKMATQRTNGKEKIVEIQPDPANDNESIVIRGGSEMIKPQAMAAMTTHKIIRNREVGQLVGVPIADYVKANPFVRKLTVQFVNRESPPYRNYGGAPLVKRCTYNVPDVKVGLTWNDIKLKMKPFNWGKYRCTANLSNGRQMQVHGATPQEAEDTLRDLASLSTATILTVSITEEKDRNIRLRKETRRMYPAYATLLVRRPDLDDPSYVDLEGKGYTEFSSRMEMWRDEPDPEQIELMQ